MFTPSEFRELYQPSICPKRVWLRERRPGLARDDSEFLELIQRRGRELEERHLSILGTYQRPTYATGNLDEGAIATEALISAGAPVIYQGVLKSSDGRFGAIPDFLILDADVRRYRIREAKLATNLADHPEIGDQMGLYKLIAEERWGYSPILEVVKGDGSLESPFEAPDTATVTDNISKIASLRELVSEPEEPVGWSKCNECPFRSHCWDRAVAEKDIAVVPHLEQGMWRAVRNVGVSSYEELSRMTTSKLSPVSFPRGRGVQPIGDPRAEKILRQARVLSTGRTEAISPLVFPDGYSPRQRPVVMFDIENDIYDAELGVKVYLWGLLVVTGQGPSEPSLIVAGRGRNGDEQGWQGFLRAAQDIFRIHGGIPFIHYAAHEKTWVGKYVERYGDSDGIAARVLENLWDMQRAVTKSLVLPIYSYSLKHVETLTEFERSQEEYGGLWSLVTYDKYLNAGYPEEAEVIMGTIKTYNREDLLASLATYEWLERMAG